jgi:hypothetical protein
MVKDLPYKVEPTNLVWHGNGVVQISYKPANYTREEIREIAQKWSDELYAKRIDGDMWVSMLYPQGWKGARSSKIGDPVKLFTYGDSPERHPEKNDPSKYSSFVIYLLKHGKKRGGTDDDNNDCLYECLKELCPEVIAKKFPTPKSLKKFCGLKRKDLIPLDKIPLIEEELGPKYKINVSGEHLYISTKEAKYVIELTLNNEHYEINKAKINKQKGINAYEKKIIIFKRISYDEVEYYNPYVNPDETTIVSYEYFKLMQNNNSNKKRYIFVKWDGRTDTLQKCYEELKKKKDALFIATKGEINIFKSGSIRKTVVDCFYKLNPTVQAEQIKQAEIEWIENTSISSLAWAKEYEGEGYSYDIISMYSAILRDQKFSIPIKPGKFLKMTKNEFENLKYFQYGIYRVKITVTKNELFKVNDKNYYTHYDLTFAKELGFEMELIEDDQPNALIYEANTRIYGHQLFRKYVDYFFQLKSKEVYGAKDFLVVLWGALTKRNVIDITVDNTQNKDNILKVYDNRNIYKIIPINRNKLKVKLTNFESYYETNFARLKPFLISRGRKMIASIMRPHIEFIKRVHTDGFISTKQLTFEPKVIKNKSRTSIEYVKIGNDIGDLKYVGYYPNAKIKNLRKPKGEFIKA